MWADLTFYHDTYLMGDTPLIPDQSFPRWEARAVEAININRVEMDDPPDYLRKCVCAVADLLYQENQAPKPGDIKSESNSGYSYTLQDSKISEKNTLESGIQRIVTTYLAGTDLHNDFVFRGAR